MNIPVLGCCADDLLGRVRNFLMDGAMREAGYLFKYKTNVTELEKNLVKLEGVFSRVQDGVIKDRRNAKEVYEDVSKWMDDADRMKKDLEAFLEERIQKRAQGVCFKLPFPNLYYRFKLGREATKKSAAVSELIKDGEPLKKSDHEVAHLPALVEGSALFPADHKYQTFESREKVLKDIVAALKDDTVAIVGIYGMPGVGKTTMMQQVRNQLVGEKCFEEVSFAVVSATLDVKSIQRQLANGLGLTDLAVMEDERERAMLLERRLNNGKKVLLILDDVWSKLSLADIGIGFGDAKSSKILMTSREKRVCDNNNCRAFKIELLNKDEAWCLFKQHAGDCIEKPEIRPLANKVLKECGELPLVIRAIGEALKAGDLFEWEDALVQLNNFSPQKIGNVDVQVYKTLELSFNLLKSQETKVCLLLCSFFGEDAKIPIDDLTRLAKAMGYLPDMDSLWKARNRVLSMVKILKTSGLLLEGGDENTVQMHDVIRDIAVSIAPKELNYGILVKSGIPEWPKADETCQRYGAVSLRLDRILELPRILECPQLRTFSLRNYGSYDPIQVPNNFFGLLEELNVLEMTHVSISSALLSLPNPKNLRMLCLERCELEDITILKGFHELEVLILKYSTIQGLPWEFRELKNLRLLNLERSELGVIQPGVLASLSYLEEFYMPYSYNWDANVTTNEIASISILDELFSLTRITTLEIHIPDIMTFPDYEFCKKLVRYNISVAGSSGYYYMRTRTIVIESETYVDLKGGIKILVEGAEVLYFRVSHGLQKVFNESNGGGFVDLKHLLVSSCIGMEYLLNYRQLPSGSFSKLNLLNVSNSGFKYLFSASVARGLEQLQELRIDECKAMEAIVRNECSGDEEEIVDLVIFHKLKSVLLTSLESLTSFYSEIRKTREHPNSNPAHSLFNEKVAFPALDNLYIRELGNIRCIWENKCNIGNSFSQLRSLEAVQCTRLENFVPLAMVQQLQNLEELIIRGCAAVTSEVVCSTSKEPFQAEVTPQLAKLRKLVLQNLPNLKQTTLNSNELHGIIYPKLTELCILNCGSLSNVFSPSVARNLEHLKILEIRDSEEIVEIIAAAIQGQEETSDEIIFPHLTYLELKNTPKLRNIWNHGCQEQHEEIKVVSNLHQPEPLFSKKGSTVDGNNADEYHGDPEFSNYGIFDFVNKSCDVPFVKFYHRAAAIFTFNPRLAFLGGTTNMGFWTPSSSLNRTVLTAASVIESYRNKFSPGSGFESRGGELKYVFSSSNDF
ncbi:hypothetical protein RJ639_015491 [Escallonia herrerae]|uniref:AAA+ ATPase domain-containing protein n=1 Tax=Escallonia herrerae TaxID=1293975 RepID=A0AA89ALI5_9ASTE|nr:hypothetical protein RJ639_015491 [Escallonia herrerae]